MRREGRGKREARGGTRALDPGREGRGTKKGKGDNEEERKRRIKNWNYGRSGAEEEGGWF